MVTSRSGRSALGCLFTLLVIAALVYFGVNLGGAYWRFYQYTDAMKQEIHFNGAAPDSVLLKSVWAHADSLGLPEEAQEISISREPKAHSIRMAADYNERVEMPFVVKYVPF